jgi:hypothetical protein
MAAGIHKCLPDFWISLHGFAIKSITGSVMDELQWRAIWIETVMKAGSDLEDALDAFDMFYGDDPIDTSIDPAEAARALIK